MSGQENENVRSIEDGINDKVLEVVVEKPETTEVTEEMESDIAVEGTSGTNGEGESAISKKPSLFLDQEKRIRVEVDIFYEEESGRIINISRKDMYPQFKGIPGISCMEVWADFSAPTYEELQTYRKQSASFDRLAGAIIMDNIALRQLYLIYHLKEWNLEDADSNVIELKHDPSGALDDESLEKVYGALPALLDILVGTFERRALLNLQ